MSLAFRNEIDITVWLAGGTIADVAIRPRSRPPLTRLFAGKPASSLPSVLPRLFSLCSMAHQVAFLSAVEAARGEDASLEIEHGRVVAVVAERLTELLRGLFVGRLTLDGAGAAAVRAMMEATAVLGGSIVERGEAVSRREAVAKIRASLAALGIASEEQAPRAGSALAVHLANFDGDALLPPVVEQSFLSAADDLEIVMRLLADGAIFSDAPDLHGRIPETGVWARRVGREPILPPGAGPAERLKARIAEVARLCAFLEADDGTVKDGVLQSYRLGTGRGAGAVECARGRLYHAVELDDEDRIVRFEFLAPTEWNFHARGPLVRSLQGSVLAGGRQGPDAVRTLVGSFDPCVGFSLSFREIGHA
ncbi:nickel-dependent hydrogenase large subunit [Bradyrhizobium sp. 200]|uniref:nickel-dependent hydrogenase large subunit n=1 Tax=Bradyrhizobium sp. 200 TaxID=2782665 RepID=UPI0020000653|nr:nickel-dependent hydrogenase large subunit [Bradyrhizobium sp. 200]UPJ48083.1 nickel-dependent hydrogenase large subunit [Bradyrhizobium sp. 200]